MCQLVFCGSCFVINIHVVILMSHVSRLEANLDSCTCNDSVTCLCVLQKLVCNSCTYNVPVSLICAKLSRGTSLLTDISSLSVNLKCM